MPFDLTERFNSAFRPSGEDESLLASPTIESKRSEARSARQSHPIERGKVEPDLFVSL